MALKWSKRLGDFGTPHKGPSDVAYRPFSDVDTTTPVRDIHITELRAYLDSMHQVVFGNTYAWTDSSIVPGATKLKTAHINEIRTVIESFGGYGTGWVNAGAYTDSTRSGTTGSDIINARVDTSMQVRGIHMNEMRREVDNLHTQQTVLSMTTAVLGSYPSLGAMTVSSKVEVSVSFAGIINSDYFTNGDPIFVFTPHNGVLPSLSPTIPASAINGAQTINFTFGAASGGGVTPITTGTDYYTVTISNYPVVPAINTNSMTVGLDRYATAIVEADGFYDVNVNYTITLQITFAGAPLQVGDAYTLTSNLGASSGFSQLASAGGTLQCTVASVTDNGNGTYTAYKMITAATEVTGEVIIVTPSNGVTVCTPPFNVSAQLRAMSLSLIETTLNGVSQLDSGSPATTVAPVTGVVPTLVNGQWSYSFGERGSAQTYSGNWTGSGQIAGYPYGARGGLVYSVPITVGDSGCVGTTASISATNLGTRSFRKFWMGVVSSTTASTSTMLIDALAYSFETSNSNVPGTIGAEMDQQNDGVGTVYGPSAASIVSFQQAGGGAPTVGTVASVSGTVTLTMISATSMSVTVNGIPVIIDLTSTYATGTVLYIAVVLQSAATPALQAWGSWPLVDYSVDSGSASVYNGVSSTIYPNFKYRALTNRDVIAGDTVNISSDTKVGSNSSIMSELISASAYGGSSLQALNIRTAANTLEFVMHGAALGGPEKVRISPPSSPVIEAVGVRCMGQLTGTNGNYSISTLYELSTGLGGTESGSLTTVAASNKSWNTTQEFIPAPSINRDLHSFQYIGFKGVRFCTIFPIPLSRTGTSTMSFKIDGSVPGNSFIGSDFMFGVYIDGVTGSDLINPDYYITGTPLSSGLDTRGYPSNTYGFDLGISNFNECSIRTCKYDPTYVNVSNYPIYGSGGASRDSHVMGSNLSIGLWNAPLTQCTLSVVNSEIKCSVSGYSTPNYSPAGIVGYEEYSLGVPNTLAIAGTKMYFMIFGYVILNGISFDGSGNVTAVSTYGWLPSNTFSTSISPA